MGQVVDLYVAGFSYTNNPAGKGGTEYRTSQSGGSSDEVFYQVDRSLVAEAILGEDVRMGYLDAEARGSLDEAGVVYKSREAVEQAGMGSYILWMKS